MRDDAVTYLAVANFRNQGKLFGIRRSDRRYHLYAVGKTGVGKSTLLKTLVAQDLRAGEGLVLFDPHGDLVEAVAQLVPPERANDVVYLNTPSEPWYFNPLAGVAAGHRSLAAAGIIDTFKKLWDEDWGPRLEHLLRNVLYTLLECPGSTFGDIPVLLSDRTRRQAYVAHVTNKEVRRFWQEEYERYSPRFRAVVVAPLQNKVGAFLTNPLVRRILTDGRTIKFRRLMDERKILLVNLAKGAIGEGPSALLGSLLVSMLSLAALSRGNVAEHDRPDFYCYLDEFHTFSTLTLATMLSELRKYRLSLVLAHQYLGQLAPEVRDAVIGNAGTVMAFRVGAKDAPLLAAELAPRFAPEDLVNLPNYHCYLRLMIRGQVSKAFSAETIFSLPQ